MPLVAFNIVQIYVEPHLSGVGRITLFVRDDVVMSPNFAWESWILILKIFQTRMLDFKNFTFKNLILKFVHNKKEYFCQIQIQQMQRNTAEHSVWLIHSFINSNQSVLMF